MQLLKHSQHLKPVKNIDAKVLKYSGNFNFLPHIKTDSRSHFDLLSRKSTPNLETVNLKLEVKKSEMFKVGDIRLRPRMPSQIYTNTTNLDPRIDEDQTALWNYPSSKLEYEQIMIGNE